MKPLPTNVSAYKKTKVFNQNTIPAGLLKEHTTADNVWAVIRIMSGQLHYHITGDKDEGYILDENTPGIVEPLVKHHIQAKGEVEFFIEFNR